MKAFLHPNRIPAPLSSAFLHNQDPKQTFPVLADESREPSRRQCIQWLCNSAAAVAVAGRFIMLFVRLASVFAALLLGSATVLAQGAKLT
ncbi:MAG: hypothetical protein WA728_35435, partial [Xanthobacteraceae bacterium]